MTAQPPPDLRYDDLRVVRRDENHNAFTALTWYQGSLYLSFRICPHGHMLFDDSAIAIVRSDDAGASWTEVTRFAAEPGYDIRDSHFVEIGGTLHAIVSAWLIPDDMANRDINAMRSYGVRTTDGADWTAAEHLPSLDGHFAWAGNTHEGRGYICARRLRDHADVQYRDHPELMESRLMVSSDGRDWQPVGNFQDVDGNETSFIFDADGAVTAVCRRTMRMNAELSESRPPYTQWTRTDLGRFIGGPLIVRWGDEILVGGRDFHEEGAVMQLYWLRDRQLIPALTLPSGGDCSYPGFVELGDGRGLVSWYSSHHADGGMHGPAAIYTAILSHS